MTVILMFAAAIAQPPSPELLMRTAAQRLAVACDDPACASPPAASRYRTAAEPRSAITSKDRAFRIDGTYCGVVGDKYCLSHGRKLFSTDFTG